MKNVGIEITGYRRIDIAPANLYERIRDERLPLRDSPVAHAERWLSVWHGGSEYIAIAPISRDFGFFPGYLVIAGSICPSARGQEWHSNIS